MDRDRQLLRHFLAALAYRTQKAIRGAPAGYWGYSAGNRVRTPREILGHMTSLMGYTRTLFEGGTYPHRPERLPAIEDEIERFHEMLHGLGELLDDDEALSSISTERLLQGPLADTMTHVGQLAMLRRLAGAPVPPENFFRAGIDGRRLGSDQPPPAAPDDEWPESM